MIATTNCTEFTTAAALLADPFRRHRARQVASSGGQFWVDDRAERPVVVEAVERLKARNDRRSCRGTAEKARRGEPGRIARMYAERRAQREAAARQRMADRIAAGKLGVGTTRKMFRDGKLLKFASHSNTDIRDRQTMGLVRCLVRAIGTIGEQAESDLHNFHAREDFSGKKGRHHKLEGSELERVEVRRDWSAALVTMCDYCSFGSGGSDGYQSRGGRSYRCYLVVRDTTTGEAHILRVPPRFGNSQTKAFSDYAECRPISKKLRPENRLQARMDNRIHAAVAWTFGLKPHEYTPAVEA